MSPVTLIVPTLDEASSIGPLLAAARPHVDTMLVADGGSRDGTPGVAEAAGARVLAVGRGYGRACRAGAEAAPPGSILVFMDGDGADDPAAIPALVAPVAAGTHEFVIGSRARGRRETGAMGWHQLLAGRLFGAAIGLRYGQGFTDMCAFRVVSRETLLGLDLREMTYGWNLEMQMKAARRKLRILEVPVECRCRTGGKSKVAGSLGGTARASLRLVATFLRTAAATRE